MAARAQLLAVAALVCGACSFDTGGLGMDGGGADRALMDQALPDSRVDDGAVPDAQDSGPCPEDIHLVIRVNGVVKTQLSTPEQVLLGDTVEIDGEGSCSRLGTLAYTWITTPLTSAILPNPRAAAISAVAMEPTTYLVKLQLDAGGQQKTLEVGGFQARGFVALSATGAGAANQINGLAVGKNPDLLYAATGSGAYAAPLGSLAPPVATWLDVQSTGGMFAGDVFTANAVRSAFAHPDARRVYFGSGDLGKDEIMVLDTTGTSTVFRSVVHLTVKMSGNFQTFHFAPKGGAGVWAATSRGLTKSDDLGASWFDRINDTSTEGVAEAGLVAPTYYAGSTQLIDLNAGTTQHVVTGVDDMIRDLTFDPARSILWVATNGHGVLGMDRSVAALPLPVLYGLKVGVYDMPSDNVRAIALDGDGDLWIATTQGAARFKHDRAVVVKFVGPAGVTDLNLLSVAVQPAAPGGRPRIFFGSNTKGVFALEAQ